MAIAAYTAGLMNGNGLSKLQVIIGQLFSSPDLKGRVLEWTVEAAQASRMSLLANANLALACVLLLFNIVCILFFGELRLIEEHNLRDRTINFLLFKIIFIGAIVEPELLELICWASCFVVLGMLKMLCNLGRDRFEHFAVAPNITTWDHARLITLLLLVMISCGLWANACVSTFWYAGGPSVVLLLLFECLTCCIAMTQTLAKYVVHGIDVQFFQSEWDWRGPLWYFIGFFGDITSLTISTCHYVHVWSLNGFSINLIDAILFLNIRVTVGNIIKQFTGWQNYRRMMHHLNVTYPDATNEELTRIDENCAICLRHLDDTATVKRLPCNHYFHRGCLQRLMENDGPPLCPVCRTALLQPDPVAVGGAVNGIGGQVGVYGVSVGGGPPGRRRRRARVARDPEAHRRVVLELFSDCPELLFSSDIATPNLRQGQRMISRRIQKRFGTRYYLGTVVRVWQAEPGSHGRIGVDGSIVMYRINYDDGDREDMEWNEISRLLVGITAVGGGGGENGGRVDSGVGMSAVGASGGVSSSGGGGTRRRRRGRGRRGGGGGSGGGGDGSSRRARGGGRARGRWSSSSSTIMANVVPVRLHDWTGRSWLYLFATSTTLEEVRKKYAQGKNESIFVFGYHKIFIIVNLTLDYYYFFSSSPFSLFYKHNLQDRMIPNKHVTLRVFDARKRTIRTALLNEELTCSPSSTVGQQEEVVVVREEEEEEEEEEYQLFAFVDFNGVEEEELTPPNVAQQNKRKYLTIQDQLRMDGEPSQEAPRETFSI